MVVTGDELQKIIDDLDLAVAYVPVEMEASIKAASALLVAHQDTLCNDTVKKQSASGRVILHRNIAGEHIFEGGTCWCSPVTCAPEDERTTEDLREATALRPN